MMLGSENGDSQGGHSEMQSMTRRNFVRLGAGAVAAGTAMKATLLEPGSLAAQTVSGGNAGGANEPKIRFVSIGTGIRGCDLLRSARQVPTGVLVGTADLYDMHQRAGIEAYGAEVPTSRDYRSLLDRKDVDAVFVAVPDHQHRRVVLDAVAAGKDVYCEKPMSHNVADGLAMVEAVKAGKRIFQAGSQRASNIVYRKATEIYASGRLGEVHLIEGHSDRNTPSGAGFIPFRRARMRRPSTGRPSCAMRRSGRSTPSGSSAGAVSKTIVRAWPATSLSICFRASSASAG
jgi:hypothetical protein